MMIYFSGIGGVGLGPLAEIAHDAGYSVAGSDPKQSLMTSQLQNRGVAVGTSQDGSFLQSIHDESPVDWLVYTAGLPPDHAELQLAAKLGIKVTKRDELLAHIIQEKNLKLIAIAGTHGKTTTTSLTVWAFQQLGIPVSYSVGTTMSFGPSGRYDADSEYFVYECDEYDRNFLHFHPHLAVLTSLGYDHPDTYPTKQNYVDAFHEFLIQSQHSILWQDAADQLDEIPNAWILGEHDVADIHLAGEHVRRNASLVVKAFERLGIDGNVSEVLGRFPGVDRRFERLADNLYTDYAVHPTEIAATIELARELNDNVVVVYQPHQNVRQHTVKDLYAHSFDRADAVYWLPTFLTREDPALPVISPEELTATLTHKERLQIVDLNDDLWQAIHAAREQGSLVLVMGAGTIDNWTRHQLQQ